MPCSCISRVAADARDPMIAASQGWPGLNSSLCRRTADADAQPGEAPLSTEIVKKSGVKSTDDKMVAARSSVEQVKAVAAKISAARRLARKLAEEKAAVSALTDGNSMEAELYVFIACTAMRLRVQRKRAVQLTRKHMQNQEEDSAQLSRSRSSSRTSRRLGTLLEAQGVKPQP